MKNYELDVTPDEVRVQYAKYSAGCTVFILGFMALVSLLVLFFLHGSSIFRSFFSIVIGGVGTLYFGYTFIRTLIIMKQGKVLLRIKDGKLINNTHSVNLKDIQSIRYGFHSEKITGRIFKSVTIKTVNNEKVYFTYYNLISNLSIHEVIDIYIIPHITPEGRAEWKAKNGAAATREEA